MIKNILILISAIFILSGCRSKTDRVKPPETVFNAEEMVDILVDIHLAEGVYKNRYKLELKKKQDPKDYHQWVLEKHGIENEKLEESLVFYGRYPEHYREIYEKVLNRLNEMESQIKVQEQNEADEIKANREKTKAEEEAKKKKQLRLDSLKQISDQQKDSTLLVNDSLQTQDSLPPLDSLKSIE